MKLRPIRPKKKMNAITAASPGALPTDEEEPTMKLSNAFIVVVILHLVAVGGIYTFESIKVHRPKTLLATEAAAAEEGEALAATAAATTQTLPVQAGAETATPAANRATTVTTTTTTTTRTAAPAATTPSTLTDSGKVHIVVKGENPHGIARKYGVSFDDLMKLNKIDDPRRLQISQKLKIPAKP